MHLFVSIKKLSLFEKRNILVKSSGKSLGDDKETLDFLRDFPFFLNVFHVFEFLNSYRRRLL